VTARNELTGAAETMTFLGPWDAQPDERIYAYNAPLGLAFMGKAVGDVVTYRFGPEERRWEILQTEAGV
jgi:transcription elongation GreA/GreB family factor